jgi:hypothetical protein
MIGIVAAPFTGLGLIATQARRSSTAHLRDSILGCIVFKGSGMGQANSDRDRDGELHKNPDFSWFSSSIQLSRLPVSSSHDTKTR